MRGGQAKEENQLYHSVELMGDRRVALFVYYICMCVYELSKPARKIDVGCLTWNWKLGTVAQYEWL